MGRIASLTRNVALAGAVALTASSCYKSDADELRTEVISGSATEVTILAGVKAEVTPIAKAHCQLYRKQAYLRDIDVTGTAVEAWTTGSRPYIHYYDCL